MMTDMTSSSRRVALLQLLLLLPLLATLPFRRRRSFDRQDEQWSETESVVQVDEADAARTSTCKLFSRCSVRTPLDCVLLTHGIIG